MATPPTTLIGLSQQVIDLYTRAQAAGQKALSGAQAALVALADPLTGQPARVKALAQTQADIAAQRARLAGTDVPADADALVKAIAALQVTERARQAALLDDADAQAAAQAQADAATRFVAWATRRLADATAALPAAVADAAQRARWKAAVAAPPLATLAADATALIATDEYKKPKKRIADALPDKLEASAATGWGVETARLDAVNASLAHVQDLLADEEENNGGPDGHVAALRLELDRADQALRAWSEQAPARLARARSLLAAVMDGDALLTAAEAASLAAAETDGGAAADLRDTRESARADVIKAQAGYADAVVAARADDPTVTDVSAVQAVKDANDTLTTDQGTLGTATGAYPAASAATYGSWSGTVPEPVWRKIVGFKEADQELGELKATDGGQLVTDDEAAEAAVAGAAWTAETNEVKAAYLAAQVDAARAVADAAAAARPARLLAAVRGDA